MRDEVRRDLVRVSAETDPGARGRALCSALDRLFVLDGLRVREPFHAVDAVRVAGVIELDGDVYLAELLWVDDFVGRPELARHLDRLAGRGAVGGIVISSARFSPLAASRSREAPPILCELDEIVLMLERHGDVGAYFREKR